MSTIVIRSGKGAPLTHTELDANFTNLNNDKLEANALDSYSTTVEMNVAIADAINNIGTSANPVYNSVQLSGGTGDQGKLSWNTTEETLDLIQNGAVLQLGQETQYHCRNETGSTILNGTLVYAAGTHGASGTILIAPYLGNGTISPKLILGIVTYDIANNSFGKVTNFGKVRGLDTSAWTAGSILYPSESVTGALSSSAPVSIAQRLPIAFVINQHATQGTLVVRCTNTPDVTYGTGVGQVPTIDQVSHLAAPTGAVMHFAMSSAPTGWLKANGATVSRTTYASLFAAIGTTFGAGNGSTTFALPDLRGEFIRGLDDGRGVDAGRALGSAQSDQNKSHTHTGTAASAGAHTHTVNGTTGGSSGAIGGSLNSEIVTTSSAGAHTHSLTIDAEGGTEARPRNIALLACIKY